MKRSIYLSILSVAFLAGLTVGCSDDKSDEGATKEGLTLSGDFGSAYAYYQTPWYEQLVTPVHASSSYDSIENSIAIPIASDRIMIDAAIPLDIKSDGTFTAEIVKEYGWIVLLDKGNGNYSFLSVPMSADTNETLITFFAKSDVDFGKVEYKSATDEAESESNVSELADKFVFSLEQLGNISESDGAFKAVANSYRNSYGKGDHAQINEQLQVVSVATQPLSTSEYIRADHYQGFAINFDFGDNTLLREKGDDICANNIKIGLKYPNSSDRLYTQDQNYTASFMSKNMVPVDHDRNPYLACAVENSFAISYFQDTNESGGTLGFFRGESQEMLAQNAYLPKGLFTLQLQEGDVNTTLGQYELDYNLPTSRSGQLLLPVPAYKLHIDREGYADYVDVKWYQYNVRSAQYKEVDFTPYKSTLRDVDAGIWVGDDNGGHEAPAPFNETYDRIDMSDNNVVWKDVEDFRLGTQYTIGSTHIRFQATKVGVQ